MVVAAHDMSGAAQIAASRQPTAASARYAGGLAGQPHHSPGRFTIDNLGSGIYRPVSSKRRLNGLVDMRARPTTNDFGGFYNAGKAAAELRSYRTNGPIPSTRILIDALKAEGVEGATLIDIGGGIGAIQHELLAAGVAHATSIDASEAYIASAQQESRRRGLTGRVTYHHGDFIQFADTIPPADIVTLDRVINVSPDWTRLVQLAAARARRLLGLVYPRDTLPVRTVVAVMNLVVWRGPVQASVRSQEAIQRVLDSTGFVRHFSETTGPWQVAVYRRP
jgi:magnesium-protoporphyrin O-methyltransferase